MDDIEYNVVARTASRICANAFTLSGINKIKDNIYFLSLRVRTDLLPVNSRSTRPARLTIIAVCILAVFQLKNVMFLRKIYLRT